MTARSAAHAGAMQVMAAAARLADPAS